MSFEKIKSQLNYSNLYKQRYLILKSIMLRKGKRSKGLEVVVGNIAVLGKEPRFTWRTVMPSTPGAPDTCVRIPCITN
jgi:hypothetical protein